MEQKLSYMSLAYHIKCMQFLGIFRLDESYSKFRKNIHYLYMRGVVCFFGIYTIQQILKIYEVREDMDKMMGTMFLLLTNTDCIYKIVIFWKKQIDEVLDVLKGPVFNQDEPDHRVILMKTVRNALLLYLILKNMALFTCFLWVLPPTVFHMQGKLIEFPVWLPFDANRNPQYYLVVFYVWIQTSWLAYCNTTMDIVITFFLEQCRTQVSILRLDLVNVVEKSKIEATNTSSSYESILELRFNKILIHHQEIINTVDKIQDIFGGAVFYQFVVSGWILCTSAYRIVGANPASVEFVSMIMYVMCILMEICLYCYYGNEITYESEMLMESAYAVDWLEMPVTHRRSLITFMERIKKPIKPMAGSLIPLSNATFISIVRSSFSFYTFLKNSEH